MKVMLDDLIEWILKLMDTDAQMSSDQKNRIDKKVLDNINEREVENTDKARSGPEDKTDPC